MTETDEEFRASIRQQLNDLQFMLNRGLVILEQMRTERLDQTRRLAKFFADSDLHHQAMADFIDECRQQDADAAATDDWWKTGAEPPI